MKKVIFLLLVFACVITYAQDSQPNVIINEQGNFEAVKTPKQEVTVTNTGKVYIDTKNNVYPVFVTSNGKYFVEKVSKKTGVKYRYYLKL